MESTRYVLIKPIALTPEPAQVITLDNRQEVVDMMDHHDEQEWLAMDLETLGLFPCYHRSWHETHTPKGKLKKRPPIHGQKLVMIGIHSPSLGSVAIYLPESYPDCAKDLCDLFIERQTKLCNHNAMFDWKAIAGCVYGAGQDKDNLMGDPSWLQMNWVCDSFHLFKLLATEGWSGQRHDLKTAQVDILGWDARGDAEVSAWLKANNLDKGRMSMAPKEILGKYCALDAQSAWHLCKVLTETAAPWPAYSVVTKALLAEMRMLLVNYFVGIPIDVPAMRAYAESQTPKIEQLTREFMEHPQVMAAMEPEWQKWLAANPPPAQHKKRRELKEPKCQRTTKAGTTSKTWLSYEAKLANPDPLVETVQWQRWLVKDAKRKEEIAKFGRPLEFFNLDSSKQLCALMYGYPEDGGLGFPVVATTFNKKKGRDAPQNPSTGKDAFPGWGELGAILKKRSKLVKFKSQAESWLANTDPEQQVLHAGFKLPGTTTMRLSGSDGCNCQNPVKDKAFMQCMREPNPEEFVWIDSDFKALESVLMAYITQDPGYLAVYGPGAAENDIYVLFMEQIPGMSEKVRALGYNSKAPTKEAISRVKKDLKNERNTAKIAVLSLSYGSGWRKLHQTLSLKGVRSAKGDKPITKDEVEGIFNAYWKTFTGIKLFNEWTQECWERTGGWCLSAMGFPISACSDKAHKLPNHVVQLQGAVYTHVWLMFLEQEMDGLGIEWYPVIWNFHDESLVRARITGSREQTIKNVQDAMFRALARANDLLCIQGMEIPMQISPAHGTSLDQFKIEE